MLPAPAPIRIARPIPGTPPARTGFPLIATLAPVGVSVAIWAATGSLFSLLFAGLGPVVALGGLIDGRRQRRRDARRDRARMAQEEADLRDRVALLNERERARRIAETAPLAPESIGSWAVERWSREAWSAGAGAGAGAAVGPVPVRLGTADVEGIVELTGGGAADREALTAAPLLADARDGIGLLGPDAACRAVARSLLLQLAATRSPAGLRFVVPRRRSPSGQACFRTRPWRDRTAALGPRRTTSPASGSAGARRHPPAAGSSCGLPAPRARRWNGCRATVSPARSAPRPSPRRPRASWRRGSPPRRASTASARRGTRRRLGWTERSSPPCPPAPVWRRRSVTTAPTLSWSTWSRTARTR